LGVPLRVGLSAAIFLSCGTKRISAAIPNAKNPPPKKIAAPTFEKISGVCATSFYRNFIFFNASQ